jgi:hypothetical protein
MIFMGASVTTILSLENTLRGERWERGAVPQVMQPYRGWSGSSHQSAEPAGEMVRPEAVHPPRW